MKKIKGKHITLDAFLKKKLKDREFEKSYDEEDLYSRVAIEIALLRKKTHTTQQELALKAHLPQQYISLIENRTSNLTLKSLQRIAEAFNKRIEFRFV